MATMLKDIARQLEKTATDLAKSTAALADRVEQFDKIAPRCRRKSDAITDPRLRRELEKD